MSDLFVYSNKDHEGHIPAAHSYSRNRSSSAAASFPAVSGSFPGSIQAAQRNQKTIQKNDGNASMPAQLYGGLFAFLVETVLSNPLLMSSLFMSGLGLLNRPKEERIPALTELIDVDMEKLQHHLNQEEGGFDLQEIEDFLDAYCWNKEIKSNAYTLPEMGVIPSKLIENLHGSDAQKLDTLFERFNDFNFTYTGDSNSALGGLIERRGDCHTLVDMFMLVAASAGIEGIQKITNGDPTLVEKHAIHGRDKMGNVYKEFGWYFVGHHWCTLGGQIYDLLFMQKSLPKTYQYIKSSVYNGVQYMIFEGGNCMISAEQAENRLIIDLDDKDQGIVITGGEERVKNYIFKKHR
jgi:hypothetical protein